MGRGSCEISRAEFDRRSAEIEQALTERLSSIEPIGAAPEGTDVFDRVVDIDSKLVATQARPLIEKLMGKKFPLKLIQKGGYGSVEEAVKHMMRGLRGWCRDDPDRLGEQQDAAR